MTGLEDEFGDIIKKARRGRQIETLKLAEKSGVKRERIEAFERYELVPTDAEVDALAEALLLNPEALLEIVKGWKPYPVDFAAIEGVIVDRITVPFGTYSSNAYILGCPRTRQAAVIDPGGFVRDILFQAESNRDTPDGRGLEPVAALITHGDQDHVGGLKDLMRQAGVWKVYAHKNENVGIEHVLTDDGDEFQIGDLTVRLIYTPGHTQGSCCFLAGPVCFTGDTLFAGSLGGATRYPGGYTDILNSGRRLMELPEETILLPGHGPATTVREEREHNAFVVGD